MTQDLRKQCPSSNLAVLVGMFAFFVVGMLAGVAATMDLWRGGWAALPWVAATVPVALGTWLWLRRQPDFRQAALVDGGAQDG